MRHSYIVLLDTFLRAYWYDQGHFGVSAALFASAKRSINKQRQTTLF